MKQYKSVGTIWYELTGYHCSLEVSQALGIWVASQQCHLEHVNGLCPDTERKELINTKLYTPQAVETIKRLIKVKLFNDLTDSMKDLAYLNFADKLKENKENGMPF